MSAWGAGIMVIVALFLITIQSSYAESEQTTLSEDFTNDPVAQDILQKIEKTKKWIAQIEERASAQKELEEKRKQVIRILEKDLDEWQGLWEEFTFDYKFNQMAKHAEENGGNVFFENYKYTNSKIQAGRAALQQVIDNGGTAEEARDAYVNAAKMKRSDLIAVNALSNIKYNLAYYNQQILFDINGQFHDSKSGNQLRSYYLDYRTIPAYSLANPKDISWREIGKTSSDTECRVGFVLVYRHHAQDYVCTTESTAEMWKRHAIVSYVNGKSDTSHNIEKLHQDSIESKIDNAKYKLDFIYTAYETKLLDLEKKFEQQFIQMDLDRLQEERKIVENAQEKSKKYMSGQIEDIREKYHTLESSVSKDKEKAIELLEKSHVNSIKELIDVYEDDTHLKIVLNSDNLEYKVVRK